MFYLWKKNIINDTKTKVINVIPENYFRIVKNDCLKQKFEIVPFKCVKLKNEETKMGLWGIYELCSFTYTAK